MQIPVSASSALLPDMQTAAEEEDVDHDKIATQIQTKTTFIFETQTFDFITAILEQCCESQGLSDDFLPYRRGAMFLCLGHG